MYRHHKIIAVFIWLVIASMPVHAINLVYEETNVSSLLTTPNLVGYQGKPTYLNGYIYYSPYANGIDTYGYHGNALRYNTTLPFSSSSAWEHVDITTITGATIPNLGIGFRGTVADTRYVYYIPFTNHSVYRYDTTQPFTNPAAWGSIGIDFLGGVSDFQGAVYSNGAIYISRVGNATNGSAIMLKYDTSLPFGAPGSWSVFNATSLSVAGCLVAGYRQPTTDGRYVYYSPNVDSTNSVGNNCALRYDTTAAFTAAGSWTIFDLTPVSSRALGYYEALYTGRYVYFSPYQTGPDTSIYNFHGDVLRYDTTAAFTAAGSWAIFNASTISGLNNSGFGGVVYDGRTVYFTPYYNGSVYQSNLLTYDTTKPFSSPSSWASFDINNTAGNTFNKGYVGAVSDGSYIYLSPYYNQHPSYHSQAIKLHDASPIANWTFNEGSGNYVNDSSGMNNNGTLFENHEWSTNLNNGSVNGTSLNFTGLNYVNASNASSLNFSNNDFTINAWIKMSSTGFFMGKVNFDPATTGYEIDTATGGGVVRGVIGNGVTSKIVTGTTIVNNNKWHMVTFVRQGSDLYLYVDNVLEGTQTGALINISTPADLYIGRAGTDNNIGYGHGTIDEVKVFNYALNSSERTIEYQRFQPVPAYPVGGLTISPTEATTYVNFSWHDSVDPQDEIIIATDSGFTNVVHDAFHSTDYANLSLTVGTTYYWRIKQFDAGTGSFGNTSATQKFTLGTVPTFIRVNVFDELNLSSVPNINVTLISVPTNTSVNFSSTGTNNWINATNPSITDGVQYLAQVSALNYTSRNILLTSPGNYSVYLPYTYTTAGISSINFIESDYTGLFPYQSTKLIIKKIINTTVVNISSDYFDSTGVSPTQLINGQQYQLYVESGTSIRSLGSYIPSASGSQTLLIADFNLAPSSQFNGLVYNFTYNGNTSIILQWSDINNELISLNETISNQQGTLVYQLITAVHSGQSTYLISNKSSKYLVQLTILTTNFGYLNYSLWYNPTLYNSTSDHTIPQPAPNNYIISFGSNVSNMSTTSNDTAPIPIWVKNIIGIFPGLIILMVSNRNTILRNAPIAVGITGVMWLTGFFLIEPIGYIATGTLITGLFVFCVITLFSEGNRS